MTFAEMGFESVVKAMVEANNDAAVLAFVKTERSGEIASAMMEANEDHAIAAFSTALSQHGNSDPTIKACADILYDKLNSRQALNKLAPSTETPSDPLAIAGRGYGEAG